MSLCVYASMFDQDRERREERGVKLDLIKTERGVREERGGASSEKREEERVAT